MQGKAAVNTGAAWALPWSSEEQAAASREMEVGSLKPGLVKICQVLD